MDENRDDQPLSSEELLRRAREGLGESDAAAEAPADFAVESYPPPTDDTPSYEMPVYTEPQPEPPIPAEEPLIYESREEPASWAPPPVDSDSSSDWAPPLSSGPAPDPVQKSSGLAGKIWILVALAVVGVGVFSFFDSSTTVDDITVGDCMNLPDQDVFSTVDTIDCAEPHDVEVFALVDLSVESIEFSSIASYPGDDAVWDAAIDACWDRFESYVGVPYESSEIYLDVFTPTLEGWDERGDRIANCLLYQLNADATDLVQSRGSLRGANR